MQTRKVFAAVLLAGALAACNNQGANEKASAAYLERSMAYEQQGQYRAAMIELRNAIQANPEDVKTLIQYAEVLIKVGALKQASELLEQLTGSEHQIVLAEAYLKRGKHVSAEEALSAADNGSYRYDELPILAAQIQFLRGNRDSAIETLLTLSQKDNEKAARALIPLLLAVGRYPEAQTLIEEKLTASANDTAYLFHAAQLAYATGDLDMAEARLNEVLLNAEEADLLINPKLAAIELLAAVLTDLGKSTEALVYTKILQDENPDAFSARQQYKEAIKAASAGELDAAKDAFEDILNQFPNNQQASLLLGLVNIEQGDLQLGEALLSDNLDAEIAPVNLIQATAIAQAEVGKTEQAFAVVERALLARPDDPGLLALFGVIALNADKSQEGVAALSKALQISPERTRLHLLLGQHYVKTQQSELALGHLRKAFNISATDWPTTAFYISQLFNNNEVGELAKVQASLENEYGNLVQAQWLSALINHKNGQLSKAEQQLANLYKDNPNNEQLTSSYAQVLNDNGKFHASAELWLENLNSAPSQRRFLELAVITKSKAASNDEVLNWLEQSKPKFSQADLPIDAARVQLLVADNRAEAALTIAKNYLNDPRPLARQLQIAALTGGAIESAQQQNFKQGLIYANQGLQLDPSNQRLTMLAAQFEARTNSAVAALVKLEQFISRFDDHLLVANDKAKLLIAMEKETEALEFLNDIWQQQAKPELANTYLALTQKLAPENYELALGELLTSHPENAGGNLIQGDIHLSRGEDNQAKKYYLQAIASNPNLVPALNNLAWVIAKNNPAEAIQYSKKASELSPNSASVLDTHGWVLYLNGEKNQALQYLQKASELAPEDKAIADHLAQVKS